MLSCMIAVMRFLTRCLSIKSFEVIQLSKHQIASRHTFNTITSKLRKANQDNSSVFIQASYFKSQIYQSHNYDFKNVFVVIFTRNTVLVLHSLVWKLLLAEKTSNTKKITGCNSASTGNHCVVESWKVRLLFNDEMLWTGYWTSPKDRSHCASTTAREGIIRKLEFVWRTARFLDFSECSQQTLKKAPCIGKFLVRFKRRLDLSSALEGVPILSRGRCEIVTLETRLFRSARPC